MDKPRFDETWLRKAFDGAREDMAKLPEEFRELPPRSASLPHRAHSKSPRSVHGQSMYASSKSET